MRRMKKHGGVSRRLTAMVLCLCMIISMVSGFGATTAAASSSDDGYTQYIVEDSRKADPNTMDDYLDRLLNMDNGSRYAGRVWTDKTVFAYGATEALGGVTDNKIPLNMETDGYEGSVGFDADFAHVFSALASSQVVNEYPPSPVDLVIVFDMSGSMGQDTRFGIDTGINNYVKHNETGDSETKWPSAGVPMAERIANSRVQATLNAINETIDGLMAQNPQNRVAVCGYGANAVVLMPLAHYRHGQKNGEDIPYLSVGGMETLYHPSDLRYDNETGWMWMNNRDTCYTVVVNGGNESSTYTGPLSEENGKNSWTTVNKRTVSNNVRSEGVKAFPGVAEQNAATLETAGTSFGETSRTVHDVQGKSYLAQSEELINAMKETCELVADDYVGYFTNTQGGIYLAYKQLADTQATTYSEVLTNGVMSTVARIPAAIIMSDGGANFAFNRMGEQDNDPAYTVAEWNSRYGNKTNEGNEEFQKSGNVSNDSLYMNDNLWDSAALGEDIRSEVEGRREDYQHRLGNYLDQAGMEEAWQKQVDEAEAHDVDIPKGNTGDEWYKVFLPGDDTLAPGAADSTTKYGKWDGLHGIHNTGADYYQDGTLSTQPAWNYAGVLFNSDNNLFCPSGAVLEVLLTAAYMNDVVKEHYQNGWDANKATKESQIELSTFTMNVDTDHVPLWGRMRLYPSLDPSGHPLDTIDKWYETLFPDSELKAKVEEQYKPYVEDWMLQMIVDGSSSDKILVSGGDSFNGLQEEWVHWKNGDWAYAAADYTPGGTQTTVLIKPIDDTKNDADYTTVGSAGEEEVIHVTNEKVKENISYNEKFYNVDSEELSTIFAEILDIILGRVFIPVSGDNDAGVGNSVTYQDPLGEYMEIKNQSILATPHHIDGSTTEVETTYDMSLLLFGEMHGLVRTGVYDYQWNDAWMKAHEGQEIDDQVIKPGETPFPMGWYEGESGATGTRVASATEYPNGCSSAEDAWGKGYVFRLNNDALTSYVPIVSDEENPEDLPQQAKNTVYTLYRFAGDEKERNELRRNPIYGDVPNDIEEAWDKEHVATGKYPEKNDIYVDTPGVYRLSDIRVWVEDTGDFVDQDGAITPNSGYDRSLYLNVPAAAIPTELATITMGRDGVLSYETNLGSDHEIGSQITVEEGGKTVQKQVNEEIYNNYCYQSTPIRLFYAVGLEEDLLLRDKDSGEQIGVDFNAISAEYINSHTTEENYVWFISNFYSNTPYEDYDTDSVARTRGDPTVSFSPSSDNRYYVFQKPLPLYAHAYRVTPDGTLKPVDRSETETWGANGSGNGSSTWENSKTGGNGWVGGEYMGTYTDTSAFESAYQSGKAENRITDSTGVSFSALVCAL